jgi:hypothetical protein
MPPPAQVCHQLVLSAQSKADGAARPPGAGMDGGQPTARRDLRRPGANVPIHLPPLGRASSSYGSASRRWTMLGVFRFFYNFSSVIWFGGARVSVRVAADGSAAPVASNHPSARWLRSCDGGRQGCGGAAAPPSSAWAGTTSRSASSSGPTPRTPTSPAQPTTPTQADLSTPPTPNRQCPGMFRMHLRYHS